MLNRFMYSFCGEVSCVHRINPVIKLLGLFVYVLICLLRFDNILFVCNISFVFMLMLLSNIDMMRYLKVVWRLKYVIIIAYFMMYHFNMDLINMNIVVFKFVFFVLYLSVIVFTTTRESIGKACSKIVNLFNLVGLGESRISIFIIDLFVYAQCFMESYKDRIINSEIKGIVYNHSNIIEKWKIKASNFKFVLDDTKEKMLARKNDMKYRMYDNKVKKKYRYKNKLCVFDYIYVILNIGMIVFYILKVR